MHMSLFMCNTEKLQFYDSLVDLKNLYTYTLVSKILGKITEKSDNSFKNEPISMKFPYVVT